MGQTNVLVGMSGAGGFGGLMKGLIMAGLSMLKGGNYPRAEMQSGPPDVTYKTHYSPAVWLEGSPAQQAHNIHELNALSQESSGKAFIDGLDKAGKPTTLNVLGDPAKAQTLFPGHQHYENCAVQSSQQIIHQATGTNYSETQMEQVAVSPKNSGYKRDSGTPDYGEAIILQNGGVPAHMEAQTTQNLDQALANGQGVITNHDAGELWNDSRYDGSGHAVNTTGAVQDSDGNTLAYVINDTGNGQNTRTVPAQDFQRSMGPWNMAVTDAPIY
jgi:hypothetical protein